MKNKTQSILECDASFRVSRFCFCESACANPELELPKNRNGRRYV
jgi:hypothetical protein